ncbi:hypothetical protein COE80_19440 [Bacillus pseudomycoides]|nr:hypothetical protein COE80_19440 [Bacillus pseudomycoides]PHE37617.1 hypothetical protein COF51_16405 [Bacillus pseudomycoides]
MKTFTRVHGKRRARGNERVKYIRETNLLVLIKRCKRMEEHYEYMRPIARFCEKSVGSKETVEEYYECTMVNKKVSVNA